MFELISVELRAPVWYILAGFILGFTVSTLWEWLYFRRFRRRETENALPADGVTTGNVLLPRSAANESGETSKRLEMGGAGTQLRAASATTSDLAPSNDRTRRPLNDPATRLSSYRSPGVFLESESIEAERQARSKQEEANSLQRVNEGSAPSETVERVDTLAGPAIQSVRTTRLQRATAVLSAPLPNDASIGAQIPTHPVVQPETPTAVPEKPLTPPSSESANVAQPPAISSLNDKAETTDQPAPLQPPPIAILPAAALPIEVLQSTAIPADSPAVVRNVPRSRGYPDDLAQIRGIGETYKRRLYAANIFTFHHIATSDIDFLRQVTQASPNAKVEEWPNQARALTEKLSRQNASYSGPLPNDLTKIPGIGAYYAQMLYRIGICTYEQLADTTIAELATMFPATQLGRKNNFEEWLVLAKQKATEQTNL